MSALTAGWTAYQTYNLDYLAPWEVSDWDSLAARQFRYEFLQLYYYNQIYTSLETYATQHKKNSNQGLYKSIRAIYNPVGRLVDTYASKVYGGQLDFSNLTGGAIPLVGADDRLQEAIRQLWVWSNWQNEKNVFVRSGAMLGDTFLKVVDERDKGKVRLEVLHPGLIQECAFDGVGNITAVSIVYPRLDEWNKPRAYEERITKESFATFRDGQPFAWYSDGAGQGVVEWPNEYGFVPLVHVPHKRTGPRFGLAAAQNILGKIDENNSQGSRLNDQISKVVNSVWTVTGVKASSELTNNFDVADTKGILPMIYAPEGAVFTPLVNTLDLSAALANVQNLLAEIERDNPELALSRIRESGGNLTAPGIKSAYSDAIDLIVDASSNYDWGQVRATQMAVTIGGLGGYKGFTGYSLTSYDNGDLDFAIGERPIITDTLSQSERVTFLMNSGAPQAAVWQEIGFSPDQVEDMQRDLIIQQARAGQEADMASLREQQAQELAALATPTQAQAETLAIESIIESEI